MQRTTSWHDGRQAARAAALLVAASVTSSAFAQEKTAAPDTGVPVVETPASEPPKPRRRTRIPVQVETAWSAAAPGDEQDVRRFFVATRGERVRIAVEQRLRDEAIHSRRLAVFGGIDQELFPELVDDGFVGDQRSRVSESVISSAIETAADVAFFGGRTSETRFVVRPTVAIRDHGVSVDASPSWDYRVRTPRGAFRLELPFIPTSAVRLSAHRELRGTNRSAHRIGASLSLDPLDSEFRCGFSFQF